MDGLRAIFRDPVSGLTHLAGALLGVLGLVFLVGMSRGKDTATVTAVSIYGVTLVLLYAASAAYHLLHVAPARRVILRRVDHAMVSIFIAGTYTPFCVVALKESVGTLILVTIWALAFLGLFKSIYWINAPRWVTAGLYVLMGWVIVMAAKPFAAAVSPAVLWLTFAGGVLYSVGAGVYAKKWPDPWPETFGFHEIWHLFVLGGSACHYAAVLLLV